MGRREKKRKVRENEEGRKEGEEKETRDKRKTIGSEERGREEGQAIGGIPGKSPVVYQVVLAPSYASLPPPSLPHPTALQSELRTNCR